MMTNKEAEQRIREGFTVMRRRSWFWLMLALSMGACLILADTSMPHALTVVVFGVTGLALYKHGYWEGSEKASRVWYEVVGKGGHVDK